jgi:hypothetical protein
MTYTNFGVNYQDVFSKFDEDNTNHNDICFIILNGTDNNFQLSGWNKSGQYNHNSGTYNLTVQPRTNVGSTNVYQTSLTQLQFNAGTYGCDNINILTSSNSTLVMGLQCPATGKNSTRFLQQEPEYTDPKKEYNDLWTNGIQTDENGTYIGTQSNCRVYITIRKYSSPCHALMIITNQNDNNQINLSGYLNNQKNS